MSPGQNQGVYRAVFLSEGSKGNLWFFLFHLLEAAHIPWLVAPSSIETSMVSQVFLMWRHSDTYLHFCLPLLHFKNPCDYIGPKQIIQDNLLILRHLISNRNYPLSCTITYTQVLGIGMWTSLGQAEGWRGALFCLPQWLSLKSKCL